jgi:two-component system phosphate regulon sensor histidine kinase PhoR
MRMSDYAEVMNDLVHDLKVPLSAAKGFIELITLKGPLNEVQSEYGDKAQDAIDRALRRINMLLELAYMEAEMPLSIDEVSLIDVIDHAIDQVEAQAASRDLEIEFEPDPDAAFDDVIEADVVRLEMVFENLLSNAVKYNRDGGRIVISLQSAENEAIVSVADTGNGISAADLPNIFDRFFRAENQRHSNVRGTGLGLAITQAIVEKHGGRMSVSSVQGEGSTFSVRLPRRIQRGPEQLSFEPLDGVLDDTQEPASDTSRSADDPQRDGSRLR